MKRKIFYATLLSATLLTGCSYFQSEPEATTTEVVSEFSVSDDEVFVETPTDNNVDENTYVLPYSGITMVNDFEGYSVITFVYDDKLHYVYTEDSDLAKALNKIILKNAIAYDVTCELIDDEDCNSPLYNQVIQDMATNTFQKITRTVPTLEGTLTKDSYNFKLYKLKQINMCDMDGTILVENIQSVDDLTTFLIDADNPAPEDAEVIGDKSENIVEENVEENLE